jgi:hypothetical protein
MAGEMDREMIDKIDAVLDRVREPVSGLTIAQLGLVNRLRYLESSRRLAVYLCPVKRAKMCCTVLAGTLQIQTLDALTRELEQEFPDLAIEYVR